MERSIINNLMKCILMICFVSVFRKYFDSSNGLFCSIAQEPRSKSKSVLQTPPLSMVLL